MRSLREHLRRESIPSLREEMTSDKATQMGKGGPARQKRLAHIAKKAKEKGEKLPTNWSSQPFKRDFGKGHIPRVTRQISAKQWNVQHPEKMRQAEIEHGTELSPRMRQELSKERKAESKKMKAIGAKAKAKKESEGTFPSNPTSDYVASQIGPGKTQSAADIEAKKRNGGDWLSKRKK